MPESFYIEVANGADLTLEQIWPDGDAPEDPSVEDVIEKIKATTTGSYGFIQDWGFDDNFDVEVNGKLVQW